MNKTTDELKLAEIDHACGLRSCINLRHLRLLDKENNKRFGDPRKLNTARGSKYHGSYDGALELS